MDETDKTEVGQLLGPATEEEAPPAETEKEPEVPHVIVFKVSLPDGGLQAVPQVGGGLSVLEVESLLELGSAAVRAQLGLPKRD